MGPNNVKLIIGDITAADSDAIVNAANSVMLGGGGVDGALHQAAGPGLLAACLQVEEKDGIRCPTGEARITPAGQLQARYVIHTVGPRYGLDPQPELLLASAYHNSFRLALQHQCKTVAVPAISCGVYRYPLREAAEIALDTATDQHYRELDITFYLFGQTIYDEWSAVYATR